MRSEEFKERALVEGRRYAKDRMVFLRELCQNARDAGARMITVHAGFEEGVFALRFEDDGIGMSFEHAKAYLFKLYASSKEAQTTSAGCFGVGFWSVLLFSPASIEIDSRAKNEMGWRVVMDGSLEETRSLCSELTSPGTRITVRRALSPDEDPERLTEETRRALSRYGRYLRRNSKRAAPLAIALNGARIDMPFSLDGPCWLTFENGPVEGAVGLGETPHVEVFARGLSVWQGTLLDELRYGVTRAKPSRHPKGLAPRYLLNGNDLNVTYDRRALMDDAALARLRHFARARMRELLARYLDQVSPRTLAERTRDWFIAMREEMAFNRHVKWLVVALMVLVVLGLWWVIAAHWDDPAHSLQGSMVFGGEAPPGRDPSSGAPREWVPLRNALSYRGPSVDPLGSTAEMALAYAPETDLAFNVASMEILDAGYGIRQAPPALVSPLPRYTCGSECVAVAVQIAAAPGALQLPIPTGYLVVPESVEINDRSVTALGLTLGGDPVIRFSSETTGELTYRVGPSVERITNEQHRWLTRLPGYQALPPELEELVDGIASLKSASAKVVAARGFVAERFAYDTSQSLADRYRAFYQTAPIQGWLGFALRVGRGDCDVKNTVLVFLLRRLGIPAKLAIGPIGEKGRALPGMHAWVVFHEQGWHIADATLASSSPQSDSLTAADRMTLAASRSQRKPLRDDLAPAMTLTQPANPSEAQASKWASDTEELLIEKIRPILETIAIAATIVFIVSFLIGIAVMIIGRRTHPLFIAGNGGSKRSVVADMLENALAHPEMWIQTSGLMRRPLLPTIGRTGCICLNEALKRGRAGLLWFSRDKAVFGERRLKRSAYVLDASDPAYGKIIMRLPGIIDLDEIAALAPVKPDEAPAAIAHEAALVGHMDGLLKRCHLKGLGIRLTLNDRLRQPRDVDLTGLGYRTGKYVVVSAYSRALREQAALFRTAPALALFQAMESLIDESPMLEPFRTSLLMEAARGVFEVGR